MKKLYFSLFLLLSTPAHSKVIVDVLSSEIGFKESFCLTIVRTPKDGMLFGLLENLSDCSIAKRAKKHPDERFDLDLEKLEYLQSSGGHLKFYFSTGE